MNSTLSTEEILAQHKRWVYNRTDRNGTRYFFDYTCGRCGGKGGWEGWPGFTCYECGGSGRSDRAEVYKVYTPEHEAKLEAQRAARAKKREEEAFAKLVASYDERMAKAGFGKEGLSPEKVLEALTDIDRIVEIVRDEFEEELKKSLNNESFN